MTPEEIQERNKQIALMLGAYTKQMMGVNAWVLEEDELNLSFDLFDKKIFSNDEGSGWKIKDLKFHLDWNWLMESVEFIEKQKIRDNQYTYTSKYNVIIDSYGCIIRTSGYHQKKVIDITNSNKKEAVFIAVSDFAKKFNNKEL
jgi:hypothetical protein